MATLEDQAKILMATIVPEGEATAADNVCCRHCQAPLSEESSTVASRRYNLCSSCVAELFGDNVSPSVALLLAKGLIMICHYSQEQSYKFRVEVRSSSRSDLDMLRREVDAGNVYQHSEGVSRYTIASLHDLDRIAQVLMPYLPMISVLLQRYTVQPNKQQRSAFAEAAALYLGKRTVHFIHHI